MNKIYDSNRFDKLEMLTWEQQPPNIKIDYDKAKIYFEPSSKPPTPTNKMLAAAPPATIAMNQPIKWRTMVTIFESTSSS